MTESSGFPERYAILTINDPANYGNRLQNYALVKLLENYGAVTTIKFPTYDCKGISKLKLGIKNLRKTWLGASLYEFTGGHRALEGRRLKNSIEFSKRYTPDNDVALSLSCGLRCKRDVSVTKIVIGSDQVWNYNWVLLDELRFRLGIFKRDIPAISYAASIGVSTINEEFIPAFREGMSGLESVSVREDKGAEILHDATGKEVTVVLDPTMMIEVGQWRGLFRGFVDPSDQYVLTYFLGKPTAEQEDVIQRYADQRGLRIRRILDPTDPETYVAGPQDFVELFAKAGFVFTDSYHACCFSALFHVGFKVFSRSGFNGKSGMNSRMDTLFRELGLGTTITDDLTVNQINYEQVDKELEKQRQISREWLEKALSD